MGRTGNWSYSGEDFKQALYIGNIYRPPKENLEFYDQFINEFTPILNKLEKIIRTLFLQAILI